MEEKLKYEPKGQEINFNEKEELEPYTKKTR